MGLWKKAKDWKANIEWDAIRAFEDDLADQSDTDIEAGVAAVAASTPPGASPDEILRALQHWFDTHDGFSPADDATYVSLVKSVQERIGGS